MRRIEIVFMGIVLLGLANPSILPAAPQEEDLMKVHQLYESGNYPEALKKLQEYEQREGENEGSLMAKFYVLRKMEKFPEALEAGSRWQEKASWKSPYPCLEIAESCVKIGRNANAIDWLEKAVDRGDRMYSRMENEERFAPLKKEERFIALIGKMKESVGLDKPANDFTAGLTSGKIFSLSRQKGKVVLLDFWATDCRPCLREIQELKKTYDRFHPQGLEIIGISFDRKRPDVDAFVSRENIPWLVSCSGKGWDDPLRKLYDVNEIPALWVIDREGILRSLGCSVKHLEPALQELMPKKPE